MVASLKLLREDNKAIMGKQLLLSPPFVLLPSQKKKTKNKKEKKNPIWKLGIEIREREKAKSKYSGTSDIL